MTDFNALQKTADEMQAEFQKVTSEFQKKMQSMFSGMTRSFFEAAPDIKAVVWSQYTPYFNDGEECIFRVNDLNFLTKFDEGAELPSYVHDLNDDEIDGIEVFDVGANADNLQYYKDAIERYGDSSYYRSRIASIESALTNPRNAQLCTLCKGLSKVINDNEDLMKAIFGDHVIVVLTPEGSETNECSHD